MYFRLLEYARIYSKVIILDYIYNINSSKILLFKIVRINITRKFFYICFKFMTRKDIDNYI